MTVTCTITHELGHSESTTLTAGPDTTGNKNSIQAIGSTISYLERYTILAITGLSTRDMDDDGNSATPPEYIQGEDLERIKKLLEETKSDEQGFLKFASAESLETIPSRNQNKILASLNKKKVQQSKKARQPGEDDA